MRIRNTAPVDGRSLKPAPGDIVLYEGEEYVVFSVGIRWVYIYSPNDPKQTKKMAKITAVVKKPAGADVQA